MNNYKFVKTSSGSNGSWYRVWTDGFIMQGGFIQNYNGTITLSKPMSNTSYTCFASHNGNTAKGEGVLHAYNKTTTSFNYAISINASGMAWMSWLVLGY